MSDSEESYQEGAQVWKDMLVEIDKVIDTIKKDDYTSYLGGFGERDGNPAFWQWRNKFKIAWGDWQEHIEDSPTKSVKKRMAVKWWKENKKDIKDIIKKELKKDKMPSKRSQSKELLRMGTERAKEYLQELANLEKKYKEAKSRISGHLKELGTKAVKAAKKLLEGSGRRRKYSSCSESSDSE